MTAMTIDQPPAHPGLAEPHQAATVAVPAAATAGMGDQVAFSTVLADTGLTRRQLDFWCRRGYITAVPGERGRGRPRVFTADEYAVICHAHDLTALGLGPEQAVELARRLRGDEHPVVIEHDHTSVVIITRTVPAAGSSRSTATIIRAATSGAASRATAPTDANEAATSRSDPFDASRAAAAALALHAAALCTCRHPRRLHAPDGMCRLEGCGCDAYQRAVPGPLSLLDD